MKALLETSLHLNGLNCRDKHYGRGLDPNLNQLNYIFQALINSLGIDSANDHAPLACKVGLDQ